MKTITKVMLASAALAIAAPASAGVTISGSQLGSENSYAPPSDADVNINFNGDLTTEAAAKGFVATTTPDAGSFDKYFVDNYQGSGQNFQAPTPWNDSPYFGVGRTGSLTLQSLSNGFHTVSGFFGSLDNYNLIQFLDQSGNSFASFTGAQLVNFPLPYPGTTSPDTNRRITFNATDGDSIYGVRFSNLNNQSSFEFDNVSFTSGSIAAAVPEPSTWALMLLGFGAVGFAMRRKKGAAGNPAIAYS